MNTLRLSGEYPKRIYGSIALLLALLAVESCAQPYTKQEAYTYRNLTIFLIQGEDQIKRNYVTLEEAMDRKIITLRETGNVGQLSVDNLSDDHVFIMAGDIVKGGKQDRTIGEDIVLDPKSKNIPLKSFCVEQSRWQRRGNESTAAFSVSKNTLSSRNQKVAARAYKNQQQVWSEVSKYQEQAGNNVKADVKSKESATSLQLTLENDQLKEKVAEYVKALQPAFHHQKNILGFAFCINGKVSTVEIFGNASLFSRLQEKLLEAAAYEAFSQFDEKLVFAVPDMKNVDDFIARAETGEETITKTAKNMTEHKKQTGQEITFRVFNTDAGPQPLHVSIYNTDDMAGNQLKQQSFEYGGFRNVLQRPQR
ncbi:MAG: hypothetical protein LBQ60_10405 [Bacteroidales bacterium]|jgi:hypothetical protein|nr:hypothetical protein [Bacteroidales bacterium]